MHPWGGVQRLGLACRAKARSKRGAKQKKPFCHYANLILNLTLNPNLSSLLNSFSRSFHADKVLLMSKYPRRLCVSGWERLRPVDARVRRAAGGQNKSLSSTTINHSPPRSCPRCCTQQQLVDVPAGAQQRKGVCACACARRRGGACCAMLSPRVYLPVCAVSTTPSSQHHCLPTL